MLGGGLLVLLKLMMLEVVVDVVLVVGIGLFLFLRGRGISGFLIFGLLGAHLGLGHSVLSHRAATYTLQNLDLICELDPIVTALDPRGLWLWHIVIRTCATINAEFLHKDGFLYVRDHIGRLNKREGE